MISCIDISGQISGNGPGRIEGTDRAGPSEERRVAERSQRPQSSADMRNDQLRISKGGIIIPHGIFPRII